MSESSIEPLCILRSRRDALRLLHALGFTGLRPLLPRECLPVQVHAALCTDRAVLRASLIELRGAFDGGLIRQLVQAVRTHDAVSVHLLLIAERGYTRYAVACDGPGYATRHVLLEREQVRTSDVDIISEMVPRADDAASARVLRIQRALDRSRVTRRFFRDVVAVRAQVSNAWTGIPRRQSRERDALGLLLLSRLMFLYFLQRLGALGGDAAFLRGLLRRPRPQRTTMYRSTLRTLFFGVLNRRPEKRTAAARQLGELPYLNGGLFEEHRLELRYPHLDLPDAALARVFSDVLEKYRFTTIESADTAAVAGDAIGIDPEMLGRIFEGLMPGEERDRTGTFYSPPAIVDRVVTDVLAEHLAERCNVSLSVIRLQLDGAPADLASASAVDRELSTLRVLDPACGSGAFLMGALVRIAKLRETLGTDPIVARRDIVARTLHGVDVLEDAAMICSLRLWLSLIPRQRAADMPPLPNLDRRIRQGDALVDPLDLRAAGDIHTSQVPPPPAVRRAITALEPLAANYVRAEPDQKRSLRRRLAALERRLARTWTRTLAARLEQLERELCARTQDRDLFGEPAAHALAAQRRIEGVRVNRAGLRAFADKVATTRALPFFSFRVHFSEAARGFDIVLSNPPWVRAHRWPPALRRMLRTQYRVCADAGWPEAARLFRLPAGAGAQVDLSLLFLERAAALLASRGTLGMLLPAKLFRSLYAGGARLLLRSDLAPIAIEDHSLDHRAIFDADAFTAVLLARRCDRDEDRPATVRVHMTRAGVEPLEFELPAGELSLRKGDARAPWLLAPPACFDAFRRMQQAPPLGEHQHISIHRGVMTGCNDVLVLRHVEPKLGDLAFIRTEGHGRASSAARGCSGFIEASCIRPALRGTDISAWSYAVQRHLMWVPANEAAAQRTPRRTQRFLRRHEAALTAGAKRSGAPLGMLHRLGAHTLGHKVMWSDVARNLRAAAVPAHVRNALGAESPVVPLNTVYFAALPDHRAALILAAFFNATAVRTFARAIAERAKDAHFRFFAWTIAVLPLPADWRTGPRAEPLFALSQRAHERGGITKDEQAELDDVVYDMYGLNQGQRAAVRALDAWFNGPEPPP